MPGVSRRVFAPQIVPGLIELIESEAHHVRDVLRLQAGDALQLFDEAGRTATSVVQELGRRAVVVSVEHISEPPPSRSIMVCSALPKGERADWMIEKLSEIGVTRFLPLITERGVVVPKGENKLDRFRRIAIEAAKQSNRVGVMTIDAPTPFHRAITICADGLRLVLTTQGDALPLSNLRAQLANGHAQLFVGPEGGWTDTELALMQAAGLTAVSLTATILRIETAAIVAAAMVACEHRGATED